MRKAPILSENESQDTTKRRHPKPSITQRLRADLERSIGVPTTIHMEWLYRTMGCGYWCG